MARVGCSPRWPERSEWEGCAGFSREQSWRRSLPLGLTEASDCLGVHRAGLTCTADSIPAAQHAASPPPPPDPPGASSPVTQQVLGWPTD